MSNDGDGASLRVAVIGAGAAGLVTARELVREGHEVVVFEASGSVGGLWNYSDEVEDDLLGRDPSRRRMHSSMYQNLRTNLPREIMGYSDFPCIPECMGGRSVDARRYPCSEELVAYFEAFAETFQLRHLIRLGTRVTRLQPISWDWDSSPKRFPLSHPSNSVANGWALSHDARTTAAALQPTHLEAASRWRVCSERTSGSGDGDGDAAVMDGRHSGGSRAEEFDAVVSCVGNYSEPNTPAVPGMDSFPGQQMHCHSFRSPDSFAGLRVLVVGASFSGEEIARRIAGKAAAVYHSARTWYDRGPDDDMTSQSAPQRRANLYQRPMVARLEADGSAVFMDGSSSGPMDCIVYCTGYQYSYPFLEGLDIVRTADSQVKPLYRHVWPPSVAPTLAFVGLLWKSLRYIQFEIQAKWVARVLSGRSRLPSPADMLADCERFEERYRAAGLPLRYLHSQAPGMPEVQWSDDGSGYDDWVARQCGLTASPAEPWRRRMPPRLRQGMFETPDTFRDDFPAEVLEMAAAAHKDFQPYVKAAQYRCFSC